MLDLTGKDITIFKCTAKDIWEPGKADAGIHIDAKVVTDEDDPDYGDGMTFKCPHCKIVFGINSKG